MDAVRVIQLLTDLAYVALGIAAVVLSAGSVPSWLVMLLTAYVVLGTAYAALAFGQRARSALGITRRRMAAVAWACGLLAAAIVLAVISSATPEASPLLIPLARLCGLVSGLCFWAGFFPPNWLSQTWRLPE